ncbi:DUF5597 domain-containing protein, partial [Candidatus Latescibacterota bacterium]
GKPFVMLGGELHNSSATSLEYIESGWDKLTQLNLNTVLVAITWETIEPREGEFDFSLIDGIIAQARRNNMKVVLLWFASWKNAATTYAPAWVKTDLKRFPRTQDSEGNNLEHLSVLVEENSSADARAYAAVMRHIKKIDSDDRTVLMMQIENESGLLTEARDRSERADKAFAMQVPKELMDFLKENQTQLSAEFKGVWDTDVNKSEGTWSEVFGADADEVFMTWYNATYIGKVADAGKKEYPLPTFTNAWQDGGNYTKAGEYPSGGPIAKMIPVWQAAAPNIDILSPDIYLPDFKGICDKYVTMGNPLLIPEAQANVANVFYSIAEHDAICYAPFGIDGERTTLDSPLKDAYGLLGDLMPFITEYHGTGKMIGLNGVRDEKREIDLGDYYLVISFEGLRGSRGNESFGGQRGTELPGYGLIIAMDDGSYLAAGKGYSVQFLSKDAEKPRTAILTAHEMICKDGEWSPRRWLNGDETGYPPFEIHAGLRFRGSLPMVQKVTVYSHE